MSMNMQLLIKTKVPNFLFQVSQIWYHADKYSNANNCWHFNIYEQNKFCAQLSWAWFFKQFWGLVCTFSVCCLHQGNRFLCDEVQFSVVFSWFQYVGQGQSSFILWSFLDSFLWGIYNLGIPEIYEAVCECQFLPSDVPSTTTVI